ncbi:MAG: Gp37-like protein [Christensenellales bacterium]|jgi:hypothetical protein
MDIIHANDVLEELGFVNEVELFDAEISQETDAEITSNSFSLTIPDSAWEARPIMEGHYVYIPKTEYGGKVEEIKHSTAAKTVTVSGLTWRGALYRKVIVPPEGETHFVVINQDAHAALLSIIGNSLGANYKISDALSGVAISWQFRYANALTGIYRMLAAAGGALRVDYNQTLKRVEISVAPVADYSDLIDLSQDYGVDMITTMGGFDRYNHVIALGAGELLDRDIVHVYRLDDGTITITSPAWAGTEKDHVTTYDYTNPESIEELTKGAIKRLQELNPLNQIEIDPQVEGLTLEMGDIVGARDRLTGMSGKATVVGKIISISDSGIKEETRVK